MRTLIAFLFFTLILSCAESLEKSVEITVTNDLGFERSNETVEIKIDYLKTLNADSYEVIDLQTKDTLVSQLVHYEGMNIKDVLLFQPKLGANSSKKFKIVGTASKKTNSSMNRCYSRFVPERTDDYAWENDKVAFRTYGPTAQKMVEDSIAGGTLSSGIDAWLKRVEYPIINKWYEKYTSGAGTYHEDTGEGLDNFHVGASRGVGGTAIKNDSLYNTSKNFINWKNITNGPIRTSFILEYNPWEMNGREIWEVKHISLDYGQNLSRIKLQIKGTDTISAGLTLHKRDGIVTTNVQNAWMSYWEPFDDSELGQGLVTEKTSIAGFDEYESSVIDHSNLYAHLKVINDSVVYYAGFGWKKSGQFNSKESWNNYLSKFSQCLQTPLIVTLP